MENTQKIAQQFHRIAADNDQCFADIAELTIRRAYEIAEYQRRGLRLLDLREELNEILDHSPNLTESQRARIYVLTEQIQALGPLKRPDIEHIDALLTLNFLKLKENRKATQVALSRLYLDRTRATAN